MTLIKFGNEDDNFTSGIDYEKENLISQNRRMKSALTALVGSKEPEEIKRTIVYLEAACRVYGEDTEQEVKAALYAAKIFLEIVNEG